MGIDTGQEAVAYLHRDSPIVRSEGFNSQARVEVRAGERTILATLGVVGGDILAPEEAGLSEAAWTRLGVTPDEYLTFAHPAPVESLSLVRGKIYGRALTADGFLAIVRDIAAGRYSDIELAAFLAGCAGGRLTDREVVDLTLAMLGAGDRLSWPHTPVMDKHSVGGLPGNRTSIIIVPIVAAAGLLMPKTSSRAITSPAGTADTMEMLAPVDLDVVRMRGVVEREGGCLVWGGRARLSPADDVLIRVERPLDLDSPAQLVASVLSKKAAAGATHVVMDVPVGPTAKIRGAEEAAGLARLLCEVGRAVGLTVRPVLTQGTQPIGRGIGPALEARDALAVLQRAPSGPADLRDRSLLLAGHLLELGGAAPPGAGEALARAILDDGRAERKFEAICEAQGGRRIPPTAAFSRAVPSRKDGRVGVIDNRRLGRVAKLAGAPHDPAAGLELAVRLGDPVHRGDPLFTVYASALGELEYGLGYATSTPDIVTVADAP
jgi:putative thymidine phosphorylase